MDGAFTIKMKLLNIHQKWSGSSRLASDLGKALINCLASVTGVRNGSIANVKTWLMGANKMPSLKIFKKCKRHIYEMKKWEIDETGKPADKDDHREDDLGTYMGVKKEKQERLTVIYARCSTAKQKENLERQKDRLRKHAEEKGYKYLMIDEIASGINEKRKGIHKLIKMCFEGKVERILIEYKDRLARFGYEYLDAIFRNLEIKEENRTRN